ncbi:hypothetical protein JCM6882_005205 [Rhodosporidiobolus microsporus]
MSFAFSYNPSDPDLPSTSSYASTSRLHDQLTAVVPPQPRRSYHAGLGAGWTDRSRFDGQDDDDIPAYGPTTSRRGRMRFVPASDGGLGVLPGTTADGREKGKGRAVELEEAEEETRSPDEEEKQEDDEAPRPPPPPPKKLPGASVRGLYESIVGLQPQQGPSAPASLRSTPAPPPCQTIFRPASEPPNRAESVGVKQEEDDGVLVLSSDDEEEEERPSPPSRVAEFRPRPVEEDDDDLIVLDPSTGLPAPPLPSTSSLPTASSPPPPRSFSFNPPPPSSRVRPLLIHQLLPSPAAAPPSLPTHYALKPDNPGWRMLQRQGWKEGAALGPNAAPVPPPSTASSTASSSSAAPSSAPITAAASSSSNFTAPQQPRGLLVPLRPTPKNDRLGLGSAGTTKDALRRLTPLERERERKKRELEERRERERRGKGTRGMERVKKKENAERKAFIAYMNR